MVLMLALVPVVALFFWRQGDQGGAAGAVALVLWVPGGLWAIWFLATRATKRVEATDEELVVHPYLGRRRRLALRDVAGASLEALPRQPSRHNLEVHSRDGRTTLVLPSSLSGFDSLLARVARHAPEGVRGAPGESGGQHRATGGSLPTRGAGPI
jgi:hypothetical protein